MGEGPSRSGDEGPGYGIGAVSRTLGVPAPTLRTWNLRYGIGPSRRSPGGHRRYDAADLRRLAEMNRLIRSGVAPAEAARAALRLATPSTAVTTGQPVTGQPVTGQTAIEQAVTGQPTTGRLAPGQAAAGVEGGVPAGARVRAGEADLSAARLARAALVLDGRTVADAMARSLERHGVVPTWERLVLPVFETICRRQAGSGRHIEAEHVFSGSVLAALHQFGAAGPSPVTWGGGPPVARGGGSPVTEGWGPVAGAGAGAGAGGGGSPVGVLLACAQDELHSLPVHALAVALESEYGVGTLVLGARTPYPALAGAIRRAGPRVVFVWSQQEWTGDPAPLAALPARRPAAQVIAGGPGWPDGLPPGVLRVTGFREAISQVLAHLA
ncbi:hypothetical protein Misp01_58800 [Microtetraspora sp. NBRC 13810]|uniref:MerR family transcriptional regulator n=1 Tax=Microtetraspora sp. NBRC 13810 TaxID=3030990 RepID=UPI0024A5B6BF|nr:MerR family transcriptional regulator [Microtetraspora sp. NBRC 13810]GLW10752.1 hypothetical protein Misp01_58800 [Microtetraspora sp. NBRC 13810]